MITHYDFDESYLMHSSLPSSSHWSYDFIAFSASSGLKYFTSAVPKGLPSCPFCITTFFRLPTDWKRVYSRLSFLIAYLQILIGYIFLQITHQQITTFITSTLLLVMLIPSTPVLAIYEYLFPLNYVAFLSISRIFGIRVLKPNC